MQVSANIQFIKHADINRLLWDECIVNSDAGLIYARTAYLDHMCPGWNGLAGPDYDWVLPLTNRAKWGISYLYQPPFSQQLGVFARAGVVAPVVEIITYVQQLYGFWEVNWHYATAAGLLPPNITVATGTNFILNLHSGYEAIALAYHKDLVKNLKRSKRFSLVYEPTKDYKKCIECYRSMYATRMPHLGSSDYSNFEKLCGHALLQQMLICRQVRDQHEQLLSVALMLVDGKRIYNLMNSTTEAGRKAEANHFLIDAIIHEFAGRQLVFDFEGSDLPGVKSFYENFGAIDQPYYKLKYNQLPRLIRLFKK